MSRFRAIWLAFALTLVVGCAGFKVGSQGPQAANMTEAVYMGNQYALAAVHTANRLNARGIIDDDTHDDVLDTLERVQANLDDASALAQAGDITSARTQLSIAREALTAVQDELRERVDE